MSYIAANCIHIFAKDVDEKFFFPKLSFNLLHSFLSYVLPILAFLLLFFLLISVDAPGFKGWDITGYDLTYRTLLTRFAKTGVTKKPDTVNIVGPYLLASQNWLFDFEGIKDLLNRLGIGVNCVITRNTKIEDIENFSAAQFNLILTNEDLPIFTK
ncbi:MAG: nitrogenase component 1 [Candidatus Aminicenantaceae bacterium]